MVAHRSAELDTNLAGRLGGPMTTVAVVGSVALTVLLMLGVVFMDVAMS
jgi:hypothetical protein